MRVGTREYLPLLLGSIVFNYGIARLLVRTEDEGRRTHLAAGGHGPQPWRCSATTNTPTTSSRRVNRSPARSISFAALACRSAFVLHLPATDFAGRHQPGTIKQFRFRDFLLFVTFFPHLIAGPIVHHREMMPQFEAADYRARLGQPGGRPARCSSVGLFKKAVLADGIADQVIPLFTDAGAGQPVTLFYRLGVRRSGSSLQMYFDFSGYSEMALGLARMVGHQAADELQFAAEGDQHRRILVVLAHHADPVPDRLHLQPDRPWRSRRRLARRQAGLKGASTKPGAFVMVIAVPTVVTMFLSGLWHGAGNQYLLFGLLHASYWSSTTPGGCSGRGSGRTPSAMSG